MPLNIRPNKVVSLERRIGELEQRLQRNRIQQIQQWAEDQEPEPCPEPCDSAQLGRQLEYAECRKQEETDLNGEMLHGKIPEKFEANCMGELLCYLQTLQLLKMNKANAAVAKLVLAIWECECSDIDQQIQMCKDNIDALIECLPEQIDPFCYDYIVKVRGDC